MVVVPVLGLCCGPREQLWISGEIRKESKAVLVSIP